MIKEIVQDRDHVKEVCEKAYQTIQDLQPSLNAVITFVDPEGQLSSLPEEGLLRGVPVAVKDNICTKGIRTTAGSLILSNFVPEYDAFVAKKLKEAGAVTICKASLDELTMGGTNGTPFTGQVFNPWDRTRIPGGSSGGSAALVAAGAVPMAIGSDTGDSIRKPAAWCGVIGVKPTYGRISRFGAIPYASSLDHVGYFTRSVEDACIALQALAGRDDQDMTSSYEPVPNYLEHLNSDMHGKKFAVLGNVLDGMVDEEVKELFLQRMEELRQKGAQVDVITMDQTLLRAVLPTYYVIANAEASSNHSNLDGLRFGRRVEGENMEEIMTRSRTEGFGPLIRRRFTIGSYVLQEENQEKLFRKAQKVRRLICEEFDRKMEGYDALLAPTSGEVAPLIQGGTSSDPLSDNNLVTEGHLDLENFNGYPSLSIPMGFVRGLPTGLSIATRPFEEQLMFDIALAVEECTGLKDVTAEVK